MVTLHHMISDGWSLGDTVQELGALYDAYVAGEPRPCQHCPSSMRTLHTGSGNGDRTPSWKHN